MKKAKLLLVAITGVALSVALGACGKEHVHEYGKWSIDTQPTLQDGGVASRTCVDGDDTQRFNLPALSDSTFWTKSGSATHAAGGSYTYTSTYGAVTVTVAAGTGEHEWGNWVIDEKPTETTTGSAHRTCVCGTPNDTATLPVLTDSVWTKTGSSTHAEGGSFTYTSTYGTVTVTVAAGTGAHEWGTWVIDEEPTETTTGSAHRTCACGTPNDTSTLPVLTDSVWTKSGNPTHAAGGNYTYTSTFGTVTVPVAAGVVGEHEWSAWTIVEEPTETTAGSAHRTCACGASNGATLNLPALSDTNFWTKSETAADYFHDGQIVYKNTANNVTYTVTTEKIPAPYANKTYFGILFDFTEETYKNRTKNMEYSWLEQHVTLDGNGYTAEGASIFGYNAKPFQIQLTNAQGAIKTIISDGNEDNKETLGYMDMASGIFIVTRNGKWDYPVIGTPFETEATRNDCATASCWTIGADFAIAITYTAPDETVYSIFIYNDEVYFNVSFVDGAGAPVAAENCYNTAKVYVKQGDDVLYSFGYGDDAMHVLDGMEGVYTGTIDGGEAPEITLTGYGVVKTEGLADGTYKLIADGKYSVFFEDYAYYEGTFDVANKTYTATVPMAHIVYDLQNEEVEAIAAVDRNINIAYTLPTPSITETESAVFKGWYTDAACTQKVNSPFVPTQDVTLYAKWAVKKALTVHSQYNSAETETLYVSVGDNVKELITAHEEYDFDLDDTNKVYFDGWFFDAEYTNAVQDATEIPDVNIELHIYAKWTAYSEFYGTYSGRNIYSATSTGGSKSVTIDPRGNVSGDKGNGKIVSYDEATQYLVWETTDGAQRNFRYDRATKILVCLDGTPTGKLANDIDFMAPSITINGHLGINYQIKDDGSFASSNPYTRFVSVTIDETDYEILIFNDRIYTSYKITDKAGAEITYSQLTSYNSFLVYDGADEFLFGAATANGNNFTNSCTLKQLDNYFGTYTTADEKTVELDGVGGITYDDKTGTYAKAQTGASYTFDVYLANNTEYWRLTVNKADMTATIVKPMVSVTYSSAHSEHEGISQNVNIAFDLPEVEDTDDFVFRGWYETADYEGEPITSYMPTGSADSVTFYAKWTAKVTVTANLNYEGAAEATVYKIGAGETLTLANAKRDDAMFLGWFTAPTGGTQFVSDETVVTENIVLYAQWGEPCILAGTYYGGETWSKNSGSSSNTKLVIDADGVMSERWAGSTFESYDTETQHVTFTNGDKTYHFWYLESLGVLVSSSYSTPTESYTTADYYVFVKGGASGAIKTHYGIQYGFNNGTEVFNAYYTRFLQVNVPTADGTEVKDLLIFNSYIYDNFTITNTNGASLNIADIANQTNIIVKVNGEWLFGVATTSTKIDGNNTKKLDEYFGEYTVADETDKVVLDGTGGITFGTKTGTYTAAAEDADYTFDVYFKVGDKSRGEYWRLTVDKTAKTATMVKPMVTVTWSTAHGTVAPQSVNINIEVDNSEFPVLEAEGFVFRHWSEEEGGSKCWRFTPTEDKTMYAVWDAAIALTLVYNNGYETETVYFAAGDTIDFTTIAPEETYLNEMAFKGWYTDTACTVLVGFTTMPATSQTIYAKWVKQYFIVAEKTAGTGFKYDATNEYYYTKSGSNATASMTITVKKPGTFSLEYLVSSEGGNYDYMTILLNENEKKKVGGTSGEGCTSSYDASKFVEFSIDVVENDVITISYRKDGSGNNGADTVWIRNISLVVPDLSAAGDYTCAGQTDIHFDGIKTFTRGEETGIGTAIEGQESTYDVYFVVNGKNVSHYTIVLNKDAHTYTITPNTVSITWNMNGHGTAPEVTAFTGVELTLPTAETMTSEGFLFLGWYADADFSGDAVTTVTPVEGEEYSYYAKWTEAFTLTIVYGNGMENGVHTIASGETVNLASYKPGYKDGLSFEGWYTDAAFETPVEETSFAINANTTVYVKWKTGEAFEVIGEDRNGNTDDGKVFEYNEELGAWITDSDTSGDEYLKIVVNVSGTLTFNYKCVDGDDSSNCQIAYYVYENGKQVGSLNNIGWATTGGTLEDSGTWKSKSINVQAGQTIYIFYQKVNSAKITCQAGIKDITLA